MGDTSDAAGKPGHGPLGGLGGGRGRGDRDVKGWRNEAPGYGRGDVDDRGKPLEVGTCP